MKKKTLYFVALSLLLAGCGHADGSSVAPSNTSSSGSDTILSNNPVSTPDSEKPSSVTPDSSVNSDSSANDGGTNSSTPAPTADVYKINIPTDSRYTVDCDKETAKKGERVTFYVEVNPGFELVSVRLDSTVLKVNSSGAYIFSMPAHDVRITVELAVNGDITIQGDVSAELTEETAGSGVFVARNVTVANDANFCFTIKDDSENSVNLGVTSFDRTKCFANISLGDNSADTHKVKISGGCTYDFYYDSNAALPCYVKRTSVNSLPSNAKQFETLMGGNSKVLSSPAMNLSGVNHVEYKNTLANEQYTWDLFDDNSSLATIEDLTSKEETGVVYKKIDGDIYSVVDSYTEGNKLNEDNDPTKNDDTFAFSGTYKLADADNKGKDTNKVDIDYQKEYVNGNLAQFDVSSPSHGMASLDFEIMYAYRTAMTVQDEITQASVNVSSIDNGDDTFTTTIISSSTYDESAAAQSSGSDKYHDEFNVVITFNKDGSPLSGTYSDTRYTAANYDFTTMTPTGNGIVRKTLSFRYTYGAPQENLQPFDATPYFISSLNPTINNDTIEGQSTTNNLNPNDDITKYLELNFEPSTALDSWQYKVRNSSNTSVIAYDNSYNKWNVKKDGTTNITINNGTTEKPSAVVVVNVVSTKEVREFNMYLPWGYEGFGDDNEMAGQALVYEKNVKRYQINAYDYNGTGAMPIPSDVTFTFKDTSGVDVDASAIGLNVSIEDSTKGNYSDIVFDATNLSISEDYYTLKMTLHTSHYHAGQNETTFTVILFKTSHEVSDMFGTWEDSEDNATMNLTSTPDATRNNYYEGSITIGTTIYDFIYTFKANSVDLDFTLIFDSSDIHAEMHYCEMTVNDPEAIQIAMWEDVTDMSAGTSDTSDILGSSYCDSEGYQIITEVAEFTRGTTK